MRLVRSLVGSRFPQRPVVARVPLRPRTSVPRIALAPFMPSHLTSTLASSAIDPARDLRGWFYRALSPDDRCAVLEAGDTNAGAWFSDVTSADLPTAQAQSGDASFDVILLHRTLGGCRTLAAALAGARRLLRPRGTLVVFGVNRLRPGDFAATSDPVPRATGWGFRAAFSRAGFADIALYVAHPASADAVYMIDTRPPAARAFFRGELAGRQWPATSPKRWVFATLVTLGLMPYLQPGFIVVGRTC